MWLAAQNDISWCHPARNGAMTLEETNILPGNTLTAIIATLIETGLEKKQLENSITSS
jgi:hypothetical protein